MPRHSSMPANASVNARRGLPERSPAGNGSGSTRGAKTMDSPSGNGDLYGLSGQPVPGGARTPHRALDGHVTRPSLVSLSPPG